MDSEYRHGVNADGTWKFQVTFGASDPANLQLASMLRERARRDGVNYVDVVKKALRAYLCPDQS
jgi:hypothetical protein